MEIYMDLDYVKGYVRYAHLEGDVDFSEEEEKDFKSLLEKDLNEEELTDEEYDRLDKYKEEIIDKCYIIVDETDVEDAGNYCWRDCLD